MSIIPGYVQFLNRVYPLNIKNVQYLFWLPTKVDVRGKRIETEWNECEATLRSVLYYVYVTDLWEVIREKLRKHVLDTHPVHICI